jgi:WD40 repeat protein
MSASDDFKRMDSHSSTPLFSRMGSAEWSLMSRVASDQGSKSQRNELWWKLANRRSADPVAEEEEQKRAKVREQCRLYRHGRQVLDLNFHPRIPILATSSEDCTVKLWEQNPVSYFS